MSTALPRTPTLSDFCRSLNRDRAAYVCWWFPLSTARTDSGRYQGEDANDFNPDRFIDERGQLSAALADTRNGGVFLHIPHFCYSLME